MKILHIWSQQQCFWICRTVWEVSLKSLLRNSKTSRCFPFKCDSFCDCFRKQFFFKSPFMIFKMSFLKTSKYNELTVVENIHSPPWKHWNPSAPDLGPWLLTWQVNLGPVLVIFFLLLSAVISCMTLVIYGYFALLWSCHASLWSCCILLWLFEAI